MSGGLITKLRSTVTGQRILLLHYKAGRHRGPEPMIYLQI